jgi:hypothetical protein
MSGTAQPVVPGYDKVLSDLISYAHDDWLGIEVVASAVRDCFDHRPSYTEVRPLAIRAVRDLINAGATAGDVTAIDGSWRFVPWPLPSEQAIQRIVHDLEENDTYPESGEIGWITFDD